MNVMGQGATGGVPVRSGAVPRGTLSQTGWRTQGLRPGLTYFAPSGAHSRLVCYPRLCVVG